MPSITSIIEKSKYAKIIYLDDETFFKISNKANSRYKLNIGQEIDEFNDLLNHFIYPAIRYKLNDLLKRKDYSENELYERMYIYGYCAVYVKPIIDEYTKKGYINDYDYCYNLIEKYIKKYGYYMIKNKIHERGIDSLIFDECYNKYLAENEENNAIFEYIKRYTREELKDFSLRKKLRNRLLYRGFSHDEINSAIDSYIYDN